MSLGPTTEAGLLSWLQRPEVVRPDGAVMSWMNPKKPGYAYPEIAGYLLSILAQDEIDVDLRNRIAARLHDDQSGSGGLGRAGVTYVFDTAMVLSGIVAHQAAGGVVPVPYMARELYEFIATMLEERRGLQGDPGTDPSHWSASYGCHLLKAVLAICAYEGADLQPRSMALVLQLLADMLPLEKDGRFRVNALSQQTYLHSACYAVEGLLVVDGRGLAPVRPVIEECANWLASVQREDGGMPAGHTGDGPTGTAHSDCTAQAVRIWTCVDPGRFSASIARGVAFLQEMTCNGGIRYERGSDDINTWATIFAAQAIRWARAGGEWRWII